MGSRRGSKVLDDIKLPNSEQVDDERPAKRLKALLEEDDSSNEEYKVLSHDKEVLAWNDQSETGGHCFKVNHEFARRFEHNKKREELHKRK